VKNIRTDLTIEEYHKLPAISASTLKKAAHSELSLKHYMNTKNTEEHIPHLDFGNAFELALMDEANKTKEFNKKVKVKPIKEWISKALELNPELKSPTSSKVYKEAKQEWFDKLPENCYVIADEGKESMESIKGMIEQLKKDPTVWALLGATDYQVSCFWKDEETGLELKSRPDVAKTKKNVQIDIKTTRDASPHAFARQSTQLLYPIQAVMQIDGAIKTGLMPSVEKYYWLAVEKEAPYNYALYYFTDVDRSIVNKKYRELLKKAAKALLNENPKSYGAEAANEFGILNYNLPNYF
jgi:hypothetical protein